MNGIKYHESPSETDLTQCLRKSGRGPVNKTTDIFRAPTGTITGTISTGETVVRRVTWRRASINTKGHTFIM